MLIDLCLNAFLGALFAFCASDRLRTDGSFPRPSFWLLVIFFVTIRIPMTAYLYVGHSDWSVHYLTDAATLPVYALPLFLVAGALSMLLTWYVSSVFIQMEKRILALLLLVATTVGVSVCVLVMTDRLTAYGSYRAYTQNLTLGIMEVKLGYVLVAWIVGTTSAASFVCLELHRDARRARAA